MSKDQIIHALTILVPTLIAVGGFISVQETTAADVVALEEAVSVHSNLPSHPVGASQMESMREEQQIMKSDLVTVRENVAAICAATGGEMQVMLPPVLQRIKSLGYKVFTNGDYNLNIFGIRSPETTSGAYNDILGCAYKVNGEWRVDYWAATTDPSIYYRENPLNVKGTAILVPGQYVGVYKVDLHAGKYLALCQRGGPVTCWRDANKDSVLDHDVPTDTGFFGINIHASTSTPYDETRDQDRDENSDVGVWSAGCQVHSTATGFRAMMDLVNKQIETHPTWKKAFTYTLIDGGW